MARQKLLAKFPETAHKNVGSIVKPRTMRECSI